jgi:hypothetical protein
VLDDVNATARQWFAAKVANGDIPERVVGGRLDGLEYFETVLDERVYWITDVGLFDPPSEADSDN